MLSERAEKFLLSVEEDIPSIKLVKYRHFISKHKKDAEQLMEIMNEIALKNRLVGEYQMIYKRLGKAIQNTQQYRQIREEMVGKVNPLINQSVNYESTKNYENLGQTYMKIGSLYFQYGQYQQSWNYYLKIYRESSKIDIPTSVYVSEMLLSGYYMFEYNELGIVKGIELDKNQRMKYPEFNIIKDLKNIQTARKNAHLFKCLKETETNILDIIKNRAISIGDLGFLYSIMVIAYKKRDEIKVEVQWSSKLENLFIRNKYKKLLEKLLDEKEARCTHPIIDLIFDDCLEAIKSKILLQVVSSFNRCPYSVIQRMTGFKQGQALIISKNSKLPIVKDPVTHSLVIVKNVNDIDDEVIKLYNQLESRFLEELIKSIKKERLTGQLNLDDDDEDDYRSDPRGRGMMDMGRMGGMRGHGMGSMRREEPFRKWDR